MLVAFARLVRERPEGSASVVMACTVDEEFTHTGSIAAGGDRRTGPTWRSSPSRPGSISSHRHKGAVRWKIRTRGVACHSSTPHLGHQRDLPDGRGRGRAWPEYADELSRLDARPDPRAAEPLGRPDRGGAERQRRPRLVRDRDRPPRDPRRGPARLPRAGRRRSSAIAWARSTGSGVLPPLGQHARRSPRRWATQSGWIAQVRGAVGEAIGRTPRDHGGPLRDRCRPARSAGLPCLVLGPGDIAQAHTKDEWIELDQVRAAVDAYYQIALALG